MERIKETIYINTVGVQIGIDIEKVLKIFERRLSEIYSQNSKYHRVLDGKKMDKIEKMHYEKVMKKVLNLKCSVIEAKSMMKAFELFAIRNKEFEKIINENIREELGEDKEQTIADILLNNFLNGADIWLDNKEMESII